MSLWVCGQCRLSGNDTQRYLDHLGEECRSRRQHPAAYSAEPQDDIGMELPEWMTSRDFKVGVALGLVLPPLLLIGAASILWDRFRGR